jgi:hypothetical protein
VQQAISNQVSYVAPDCDWCDQRDKEFFSVVTRNVIENSYHSNKQVDKNKGHAYDKRQHKIAILAWQSVNYLLP